MGIPLVSIALCTYNGERFLKEQLDSLINQDYPSIEIIIVDDCSTDRTLEILNQYSSQHSFIKVVQNSQNLGYKQNFEKAIALCEGDYIALSDQDDIWQPNKISLLSENIGEHILIYHDSEFIDETGLSLNKKMSDIVNLYSGKHPEAFVFFNSVSSHALMFKKELKKHLERFPKYINHDAWIGFVAANIGSLKILNLSLVKYRQHSHSSTDILKRKEGARKKGKTPVVEVLKEFSAFTSMRSDILINELYAFYDSKYGFSIKLFYFLLSNYERFFPIYKKPFLSKLNFAIKHSKIGNKVNTN
mgnify:CR=1 FL=1